MTMAPRGQDRRSLNPLITPAAEALLVRILEHADAPRWNYRTGDWIEAGDLEALERFREEVFAPRPVSTSATPPPRIVQALAAAIPRVEWLRSRIPPRTDLSDAWGSLPCMSRADLVTDLGFIVPDDADLSEVAVYETSGTTGHRIPVPNSARGASSYAVLLERAMRQHGVDVAFSDEAVGCFLICAQRRTITYATVHAVWNNSGYAKINLNPTDWPGPRAATRFVAAFDPPVVCGDPIAFAEMVRLGVEAHPRAMISTAVALAPIVRERIERAYGCPVIDTYSLNETGLVAYACREGGYHVLPPDLHVEVLDADGREAPAGTRGEIAVTVFRNPFLPLLRYRTGDHARLEHAPCACGDPTPRLLEFEGRAPVRFRAADGSVVNAVDLSQAFRQFPLLQHRIVQRADGSCEAWIRPMGGDAGIAEPEVAQALRRLLGDLRLSVHLAPEPGAQADGKVAAYASELHLEGEA